MAGNKVTINLTDEQQKQIKNATGKNIRELNLDLEAMGSLSEKDLQEVVGGYRPLAEKATELRTVFLIDPEHPVSYCVVAVHCWISATHRASDASISDLSLAIPA